MNEKFTKMKDYYNTISNAHIFVPTVKIQQATTLYLQHNNRLEYVTSYFEKYTKRYKKNIRVSETFCQK
jgi:hypothetical protein